MYKEMAIEEYPNVTEMQATIAATAAYLSLWNIPHELRLVYGTGAQLVFRWANGADCVCHEFSIGHEKSLVESYGFPWDNGDVSVFTPYEFAVKVKDLFNKKVKDLFNEKMAEETA